MGFITPSPPVFARDDVTITDVIDDGHIQFESVSVVYTKYSTATTARVGVILGEPDYFATYIEFNLTGQGIPVNAIIDKVELKYYISTQLTAGVHYAKSMETQPSISSNQTIYVDINNGTTYYTEPLNKSASAYHIIELAGADSDLNVSKGYFAVGIGGANSPGSSGYIHTIEGANPPELIVSWHLAGDYEHYLNGAYYENGTYANAINVTVDYLTSSEVTELNGSKTVYSAVNPDSFYWEISTGIRRVYNLGTNGTTFYVFLPESSPSVYDFTIVDYTGKIGTVDAYLEAYRYVNGTKRLIERNKISDIQNTVPLNLVPYKTYYIQVVLSDGTTFDFGQYVPGYDPEKTLTLRGMSFDSKIQLVYKYILVDARRINNTSMDANYTDTLNETLWVRMTITYWNDTIVYQSNQTGSSIMWQYNNLLANYRYKVFFEIKHYSLGDFLHTIYLDAINSFQPLPDLSILGTWGGLDTDYLYSIAVLAGSLGAAWYVSAAIGLLIGVFGLAILVYIGASPFSWTWIIVLLFISILYILYKGDSDK